MYVFLKEFRFSSQEHTFLCFLDSSLNMQDWHIKVWIGLLEIQVSKEQAKRTEILLDVNR